MSEAKAKQMHEAALRVLTRYDSTGEPYTLFLSSWSYDTVGEIFSRLGVSPGMPPRSLQVRIGIERQVRIILQQDQIETVAVYRKGDDARIAIPDEWPALSLADQEWEARVSQIAESADLIVVFWGVTTDGLREELAMCASESNALKTVVITPATPRDIFLSEIHKIFPRIAPLSEIPPLVALHPEFTPLINRMKAIKGMDPTLRSEFIDTKERLKRFPLPPTSGRFAQPMWVEYRDEP